MAKAKKFELESPAPILNEEDKETLAAIDEGLDKNGFILPGLGDAGDRAYGTK